MTDAGIPRKPAVSKTRARKRLLSRVAPVATVVGCLLAWEGAVRGLHVPIYMLPPPSMVI